MAEKKKILLVEDDIFLRELSTAKLEQANFDVDVATSGTQGLEYITTRKYDLVLLDIMLPEMNGFDVLKNYQKSVTEDEKKPYIMMMTNLSENEQIAKAQELGADNYIVKAHYSPTEILKKVEEILKD